MEETIINNNLLPRKIFITGGLKEKIAASLILGALEDILLFIKKYKNVGVEEYRTTLVHLLPKERRKKMKKYYRRKKNAENAYGWIDEEAPISSLVSFHIACMTLGLTTIAVREKLKTTVRDIYEKVSRSSRSRD